MYNLKGKKNIHASVKWWAAYKFIVLLQHRRMLFSTKVLLPVKHTHTSSGKIVLVVSKHFPMPLSQPLTLFSLTSSLSFPFCILPLFPALPLIPSEPGTPLGDKATVFPEKFFKRRSSYCDQEEDEDRTDIRGMAAHMYSQCGSQMLLPGGSTFFWWWTVIMDGWGGLTYTNKELWIPAMLRKLVYQISIDISRYSLSNIDYWNIGWFHIATLFYQHSKFTVHQVRNMHLVFRGQEYSCRGLIFIGGM